MGLKPIGTSSISREMVKDGSRYMVYPTYMSGHSQTGGSHTLWGPPVCGTRLCVRDLAYMPGTTYNFHKDGYISKDK